MLISAPLSTRNSTVFSWPSLAAMCRGVLWWRGKTDTKLIAILANIIEIDWLPSRLVQFTQHAPCSDLTHDGETDMTLTSCCSSHSLCTVHNWLNSATMAIYTMNGTCSDSAHFWWLVHEISTWSGIRRSLTNVCSATIQTVKRTYFLPYTESPCNVRISHGRWLLLVV